MNDKKNIDPTKTIVREKSVKDLLKKDEEVKKITVVLNMDKDRLNDLVDVDQYIGMQEGNTRAIVDVLSLFVWDTDNNEYYSFEEGRKKVGKVKMMRLNDLAQQFFTGLEEAAVPPDKGSGS